MTVVEAARTRSAITVGIAVAAIAVIAGLSSAFVRPAAAQTTDQQSSASAPPTPAPATLASLKASATPTGIAALPSASASAAKLGLSSGTMAVTAVRSDANGKQILAGGGRPVKMAGDVPTTAFRAASLGGGRAVHMAGDVPTAAFRASSAAASADSRPADQLKTKAAAIRIVSAGDAAFTGRAVAAKDHVVVAALRATPGTRHVAIKDAAMKAPTRLAMLTPSSTRMGARSAEQGLVTTKAARALSKKRSEHVADRQKRHLR
jgi:hypothetical protein